MIRAVLFDFYGTLARAVAWGPSHEEVFERHGYTLDPGAWDRVAELDLLDGVEHVEQSASRDRYVAWERERLRERAAACGVGEDDLERLVADLHDATKTYTLEPYPEAAAVLKALRDGGVTVAVCSNWDWDLDRALASTGVAGLVDVVVTSAQAGARKPHPRIFRHTLERCGGEPAEALFVGDTWVPDVEGPRAVGMAAVHVRRDRDGDPGPEAVGDLRAVLDLVRPGAS